MNIYPSIPASLPPTALAIGFFDGVHRGHRALLDVLKKSGSHCTVLTFIQHPFSVLKTDKAKPCLLTPWPLKLALMEPCGIDAVILLPFTAEFAATSYDALLSHFSLTHLVLGEGDSFGKNREGNPENLARYAAEKRFSLQYVPKTRIENEIVSSSAIRKNIGEGNLAAAARLLGRPHAFYAPPGETRFHTREICLPPDGEYKIRANRVPASLSLRTEPIGRVIEFPAPFSTQTLISFDPEDSHV